MARRGNIFNYEALILIFSKLPWWFCVGLAPVMWFALHAIATTKSLSPQHIADIGSMLGPQIIRMFAAVGQYLLPAALLLGAFVSIIRRWRRRDLFNSVAASSSAGMLENISWQQFEQLVGEAFRRRGFSVAENNALGPDGGIDLRLSKDDEKFLVQCKRWRALKVGVSVVRELYGVMAAEQCTGGFVVTSGRFTAEASDFAAGRNIELIDGAALRRWIQVGEAVSGSAFAINGVDAPTLQRTTVNCPKCNSSMVRRVARRGPNAGNEFWGCPKFPACRGVR